MKSVKNPAFVKARIATLLRESKKLRRQAGVAGDVSTRRYLRGLADDAARKATVLEKELTKLEALAS